MLQRPGKRRFQFGYEMFWSRPWHGGARACSVSVSRGCTHDAVQDGVRRERNGRVHISERERHSRCPERARVQSVRGLGRGLRAAWAAASHWAVSMVARGLRW
jgi:hypothetical protein